MFYFSFFLINIKIKHHTAHIGIHTNNLSILFVETLPSVHLNCCFCLRYLLVYSWGFEMWLGQDIIVKIKTNVVIFYLLICLDTLSLFFSLSLWLYLSLLDSQLLYASVNKRDLKWGLRALIDNWILLYLIKETTIKARK